MTMFLQPGLVLTVALLLAGCAELGTRPEAELGRNAPKDAAPGTCWDKSVTDAVVETISEDVLVRPAQISPTGTIQSPPIYRTQSRQRIVRPRQESFVQVVCATDLTTPFVASLQRALAVRGYMAGAATGFINPATRAAILAYQRDTGTSGPVNGVLTIAAARQLGLWAVDRATLSG